MARSMNDLLENASFKMTRFPTDRSYTLPDSLIGKSLCIVLYYVAGGRLRDG